ncbi:hypothetical protein [Erwinia psidii]|uniref:hypothetical protein n=1 Tax=Erwinia psidii TaxID=69224 RepID=UPI000F5373F3|nr:hypothetical protein [Erwinia psidii]MCX8957247.1 hypothetical protein [Erwinia psidii]
MHKIYLYIRSRISLLSKAFLFLFIFSASTTPGWCDYLGQVTVDGNVPLNPTYQQVWQAHWGAAYDKCKTSHSKTKSVNLMEWVPFFDQKPHSYLKISSLWECHS